MINLARKATAVRAGVVSAAIAATALVGIGSPAEAAYPTTTFTVTYGNTFSTGNITWFNQSVRLVGSTTITAGNWRGTQAGTYYYNSNGSDVFLDGAGDPAYHNTGTSTISRPFDFTVQADVTGGAAYVKVTLVDQNGVIAYKKCFKSTPC
ncbi:hypothetical protein [Actinoplanes sp. HUAS TT8]|uniref:hypothetical protein n=1 Tax=Actinoplanes sp. HUAS TT8 TaxID=3447453 RepID=UPI003F5200A8